MLMDVHPTTSMGFYSTGTRTATQDAGNQFPLLALQVVGAVYLAPPGRTNMMVASQGWQASCLTETTFSSNQPAS